MNKFSSLPSKPSLVASLCELSMTRWVSTAMDRLVCILAFVVVIGTTASADARPSHKPQFAAWPNALQSEVLNMYHAGFSGQIHLFVKDLATGTRYTHNAATPNPFSLSGIFFNCFISLKTIGNRHDRG